MSPSMDLTHGPATITRCLSLESSRSALHSIFVCDGPDNLRWRSLDFLKHHRYLVHEVRPNEYCTCYNLLGFTRWLESDAAHGMGQLEHVEHRSHGVRIVSGSMTGFYRFKANINETVIRNVADALIQTKLLEAGYKYLIMDAGWSAPNRTTDGERYANPVGFPSGMADLALDLHHLGFKVGLYSDGGLLDCNFDPGSYGYEDVDAQTFADWGVDLLKYDNCGGFHSMVETHQVRFGRMRDALKRSGRDIIYSLCQWGSQFPWFWADSVSHAYRMSGDITALFGSEGKADCPCKGTAYCLNTGYAGCSVLTIIRKMRQIAAFPKAGSWADADMLEVGNIPNATLAQDRTHFAFWAAFKSPLVIGADPSRLSAGQVEILTNSDLIAMNQDPLGKAILYREELSKESEWQVWSGPLKGGNTAVLVLNETPVPRQNMSVALDQVVECSRGWNVKEVWKGGNSKVISGDVVVPDMEPWDTSVLQISCL